MTTGLVLIAAILVLGGVIATVGDRLGMKVGKARLSLFRLRPRQTATLITILTGVIISASTFGILFAIDDQLRTGVFELEEIQDDLETAREDLNQSRQEKRQTEADLRRSRNEQKRAERRLRRINRSLRGAIAQQQQTETQLDVTQERLRQVETNYQQALAFLQQVSGQVATLRSEISQLQTDRRQLIAQREREIAERDRIIAQKEQDIEQQEQSLAAQERAIARQAEAIAQQERVIAEREALLAELENQREILFAEIEVLEEEFQGLRLGSVVLFRNQILASGVLRVLTPGAAPQAVDRILREANQFALRRITPGSRNEEQQVLQITNAQVDALTEQISDGQDYVVRVLSAGNYVVGEPCVLAGQICIQVYTSAVLNEVVFQAGEAIASISIEPTAMDNAELVDRIYVLLQTCYVRARQVGIPIETIQVADGGDEALTEFFNQIKEQTGTLEIRVVAAEATFTSGPLQLELEAVQNEQVLFSTRS
jgi:uncharacterized protein (DUF3084 family)